MVTSGNFGRRSTSTSIFDVRTSITTSSCANTTIALPYALCPATIAICLPTLHHPTRFGDELRMFAVPETGPFRRD